MSSSDGQVDSATRTFWSPRLNTVPFIGRADVGAGARRAIALLLPLRQRREFGETVTGSLRQRSLVPNGETALSEKSVPQYEFQALRYMASDVTDSLRLIVGLGNPGSKYTHTRHNVGFDVLETLAQRWQIPLSSQRKFQGDFGEGMPIAGHKLALLKPTTYMNRSGQAVRAVVDWYKWPPESVLVIYDDMALPLGRLRVRPSGSAGGHNGMKSIIAHLGTQDFPRLRVGIGSTHKVGDRDRAVVNHVLGKFAPDEKPLVETSIDWAIEAVETLLRKGVEATMSAVNGRSALPESEDSEVQ